MVAAFDLVHAMRGVFTDQSLLDIERENAIVERLDEVSSDSVIVLCGEGELLHDWSQRDGSH